MVGERRHGGPSIQGPLTIAFDGHVTGNGNGNGNGDDDDDGDADGCQVIENPMELVTDRQTER